MRYYDKRLIEDGWWLMIDDWWWTSTWDISIEDWWDGWLMVDEIISRLIEDGGWWMRYMVDIYMRYYDERLIEDEIIWQEIDGWWLMVDEIDCWQDFNQKLWPVCHVCWDHKRVEREGKFRAKPLHQLFHFPQMI